MLSSASADEVCTPTTSNPEVDLAGYYVDNDVCQLGPEPQTYGGGDGGCLFSIWFYQESNGMEGLQRIDEVKDDTCGGQIEGDTLAFF